MSLLQLPGPDRMFPLGLVDLIWIGTLRLVPGDGSNKTVSEFLQFPAGSPCENVARDAISPASPLIGDNRSEISMRSYVASVLSRVN